MEEEIKALFCSLGADLCGIAAADNFVKEPRPSDIWPQCKSVIVLAKAMPKGALISQNIKLYNFSKKLTVPVVDHISFEGSRIIEDTFDCLALPIPSDDPAGSWDEKKQESRGIISLCHAAEFAGLGCIGRNSLVVNEIYGNRLTFGAVLVDIELMPDKPAKSICLPECDLCIKNCPAGALKGGNTDQSLCRSYAYTGGYGAKCNICRTVCPMRFGV